MQMQSQMMQVLAAIVLRLEEREPKKAPKDKP